MKKLVASVGLVALGASGLQTASAQDLTTSDPAKPWSVSATLRGFYDSNRDTLPDDYDAGPGYEKESFGYEISPAARFKWAQENTSIGLGYTYSYKWYDEKSIWDDSHDSQSHEVNLGFEHAFSPRYRISAVDSFVVGQEPDQLRAGNTFTSLQKVSGDNFRNEGKILFGADLTRSFGLELGYGNSWFDYDDDESGFLVDEFGNPVFDSNGNPIPIASTSGLLDRIDQVINIDGRLTLTPSTVGVLGYAYADTGYNGDEILGFTAAGEPIYSDDRNNRSHYFYVGADHAFTTDFSGNLRVGARYNDYYNDENSDNGFSPYLRASVRWAYLPTGHVEGGVNYDRTATDLFGVQGGDFVRDQDAFTVYGALRQKLTTKLYGSLTAQFQNSTFNGGSFDDENEQFYLAGLNLEYQFNRHFAAHVGYNYDFLSSDIPGREYDRNRVYLGVTATY